MIYPDEEYDRVTLENTDITLRTHLPSQCAGEVCTVHNRSEHLMRSWPQHWRGDRGIMERICEHGVGHPDPDEYAIISGRDAGVHGCDGCCAPTVEVPMDKYPKLGEVAESWKEDSTFRIPDIKQLKPAIGTVDYLTLKIYTDHGWEESNGEWREASSYPRLYEVVGDTFSSEDHPLGWFKLPDFTARVVVNLPESEYSSFHGRDVEAPPWNRHRQLYHTDARFYHTINRLSQGDLTPRQSIEILIDSLAEACGELETIRNVLIDRTLHPWENPGRIVVEGDTP